MQTIDPRFVVRDSRPGTGSGLFAACAIRKGEYLLDYTGEKIPTKTADISKSRYLFEIDHNWTIDAEGFENTARYINHSCEPNCEAEIYRGRIRIHAARTIQVGEEFTTDYGEEYFAEFIRPIGCKCARCV